MLDVQGEAEGGGGSETSSYSTVDLMGIDGDYTTGVSIDITNGTEVTLKVGDDFKIRADGSNWLGDASYYREEGGSYLDFSTVDGGYGNCGVKEGPHTYKITVDGDVIVFTLVE